MTLMISLIGEQPIPNLLPLRHFNPAVSLLVYSSVTKKAANRLRKLAGDATEFLELEVDAYDVQQIQTSLLDAIAQRSANGQDLLFNITGGTKPMSLAAFLSAQKLAAPVIYLQSEKKRSRLFRYEFQQGSALLAEDKLLPSLINIKDYLGAHVDQFTARKQEVDDAGHRFEQNVLAALKPHLDEVQRGVNLGGVVDIDMIVRWENQVGVIETKLGSNGMKKAIDQINTAGGRAYLGTYTQKFLVSDQDWLAFSDLKDLAIARQIKLIELPDAGGPGGLSPEQADALVKAILNGLGKPE